MKNTKRMYSQENYTRLQLDLHFSDAEFEIKFEK